MVVNKSDITTLVTICITVNSFPVGLFPCGYNYIRSFCGCQYKIRSCSGFVHMLQIKFRIFYG